MNKIATCQGKTVSCIFEILSYTPPVRARGVKSRMCPPYPQRDRKRRLNGAVCRNHRIKRVVPCRCLDGHVKEPYEMSMAWEPDRRSNFFFSPPAHLCAVTYMTEISLIVTLNNQFNSTQPYHIHATPSIIYRLSTVNRIFFSERFNFAIFA